MDPVVTPPAMRVAPSRAYGSPIVERAKLFVELAQTLHGPGDTLNLLSSKQYERFRDAADREAPIAGVHRGPRGVQVADVRNPDAPDGRWDPYAWLPRFQFDRREDALPVSPSFDAGAVGRYDDGVIGGDQPLTASFHVTRKGEYTVLTYGLYMAHNKAGAYHDHDYAAAQVYLKPGKDGKLAPTHLFTTWHRGGIMLPWQDVQQDAQGRPVLQVGLGTHAIRPVGRGEAYDRSGLAITGTGQATLGGKPLPGQVLGFEAFQGNVASARRLVPGTAAHAARAKVLGWGGGSLDPYLPSSFEGRGFGSELLAQGEQLAGRAIDAAEGALRHVKGALADAKAGLAAAWRRRT